jgi:hypothetical protein
LHSKIKILISRPDKYISVLSLYNGELVMTEKEIEDFLKIRKKAAQHIDPKTAEVDWNYGMILDPYGIDPDLPEECRCVGRIYFARSPESNVWVSFYDLPKTVCSALWEKHGRDLAFPAGLLDSNDIEMLLTRLVHSGAG